MQCTETWEGANLLVLSFQVVAISSAKRRGKESSIWRVRLSDLPLHCNKNPQRCSDSSGSHTELLQCSPPIGCPGAVLAQCPAIIIIRETGCENVELVSGFSVTVRNQKSSYSLWLPDWRGVDAAATGQWAACWADTVTASNTVRQQWNSKVQ